MTDQQWWDAHAPFLGAIADASRVGQAAGETH